MDAPAISAAALRQSLASREPPIVIDAGENEIHTWNPDLYK